MGRSNAQDSTIAHAELKHGGYPLTGPGGNFFQHQPLGSCITNDRGYGREIKRLAS
jgi:hypothetical protein